MITNRFIYGGIEKLIFDIFEHKNDPNIHYDLLTLITEKDDMLVKKITALGVGYYCLKLDKYNVFKRQIYHYKALYAFLKYNKYDVVHINITSYLRALDMFAVKLAGVKKRIIHSHSANVRDSFTKKLLRPIRKFYDYTATDFLACSNAAAKYLFSEQIYYGKEYTIINNGIDINKFIYSDSERKKMRYKLGLTENMLLIGHVGRLTEAKNHSFLLDVFKELHKLNSNSRLILVGDGELKYQIKEKIERLGLQDSVIMYGSSSNIRALLSSMDIFLFPSKWEGLGISIVEAQCNGLPCYISENIPKSVVITTNIQQYNVALGAECWAKKILERDNSRIDEVFKIRDAGFDIVQSVLQLEEIYLGKEN